MKRSGVTLADIAEPSQLARAFYRAARGKRDKPVVRRFENRLALELDALRGEILTGTVTVGVMTAFDIRDPKPRRIHAPCFRERVLHHAVMVQVGPVLERALVFDSYACREGKGALAAVKRAQTHARRFPWHTHIDIRRYFASIDHARLLGLLERRFKNDGVLALLARMIDAYHATPGKGLPMGALTSQQFANVYLSGLDRMLLETSHVRGIVRYMDDTVWWSDTHAQARDTLQAACAYAEESLALEVKSPAVINKREAGLSFCGYRIFPGALRLSRRRKRCYAAARKRWERAFAAGDIDAVTLQAGYASALGITAHTDASAWRREQLRRVPPAPAVATL